MIGQTDNKPNVSRQQSQAGDGLPQSGTAPFERMEKDEDSASVTVSIVDDDAPTREMLSPREWEVLALLARGCTFREIDDSFHISENTVNTHARRIYEKLQVRFRAKAVAT
jgi:ATP/maltotriose-dependent transcriptional regulator MalT